MINNFSLPVLTGRQLDILKICAAVFMVIDHINFMLLKNSVIEMAMIGRGTFPLFCYALAVAVFKQPPEKQSSYGIKTYGVRVLMLALLVEPLSLFTRDIGHLNVLFTLGLSAVITGFLLRADEKYIWVGCAFAFCLQAMPAPFEFGVAGMMMPVLILLVMMGRFKFIAPLLVLAFASNMVGYGDSVMTAEFFPTAFLAFISVIIFSALGLYVAQKIPQGSRFLPKYFLHIFYPAHLIILWGVGKYLL